VFTSLFLRMLNREASSPKSKAGEILKSLSVREGWVVADIGSGGGYFTIAFARNVGPAGRVYAVDTRPDYLEFVHGRAERAGLTNIVCVPVKGDMLDMPEGALDLIFVRNVFHHLPRPVPYMANLRKHLKPGGRIAVIDHKPAGGLTFVSLFKHNTSPAVVMRDMEDAGYCLSKSFDFLPSQSFSVFACPH
jgi:arsenite methyltransferase